MSRRMSVYHEPYWGSKVTGEVTISKDGQGRLYVNNVQVVDVRVVDLFSLLMCVDGSTHIVLTGFLRLVQPTESAIDSA